MKARSLLLVLLASTFACGGGVAGSANRTTPTASGTTYPIRLHRRGHVGDRTHIVFDAIDDNQSSMHFAKTGEDAGSDHKTKRSHLDGVMTTVALDARQDELRATLDVTTLTVDDAVLLQNKRIDITKAPKADDAILMVDGAPVSSQLRKVLKDLLALRVGGATDDEIFGTAQPQLVGGHWAIDGARARADLAEDQGKEFLSTRISGESTFVGVKHVGNVDALEVKAEMRIDGLTFPLPEGATADPARANAHMSKLIPVDENRGVLESHSAFDMTVRIHVPSPTGDVVDGDIVSSSHYDDQMTPL